MTGAMRWLAAVAALGLVAGSVAPVQAKMVKARAKPKKRKVVRRATRPPVLVAVPVPAPPPVQAPAPLLSYADYRWLDDAGAMLDATAQSAPDLRFAEGGTVREAWQLSDGALIVAERASALDTRLYFYLPDMAAPFLVRDRVYSYGFERGSLAAVYDADGRLDPLRPDDWREREAADLYARGRQLWYALRTRPAPVARTRVEVEFGTLPHWRENDGWRAYRRGEGFERGRERDERYRREREDRARRPAGIWPGSSLNERQRPGSNAGWSQRPAGPSFGRATARPAAPVVTSTPPAATGIMPPVPPGQPGSTARWNQEPGAMPATPRPSRSTDRPFAAAAPAMSVDQPDPAGAPVAAPERPRRAEVVREAPPEVRRVEPEPVPAAGQPERVSEPSRREEPVARPAAPEPEPAPAPAPAPRAPDPEPPRQANPEPAPAPAPAPAPEPPAPPSRPRQNDSAEQPQL